MDTTEICFDDSSNEDENLLKLAGNRKKMLPIPWKSIQLRKRVYTTLGCWCVYHVKNVFADLLKTFDCAKTFITICYRLQMSYHIYVHVRNPFQKYFNWQHLYSFVLSVLANWVLIMKTCLIFHSQRYL